MTTWQAIRRIKWDDTYDALVLLIKKGINTRKSIKAKKRLERWTTVFEIDKGHLVYRTTTPQTDQIDTKDGKPLLEAYKRPKTYRVVPPAQKEDVILKLHLPRLMAVSAASCRCGVSCKLRPSELVGLMWQAC